MSLYRITTIVRKKIGGFSNRVPMKAGNAL